MTVDAKAAVLKDRQELTDWLFEKALPLWWNTGADHQKGGFFEKIDKRGHVVDEPRRTRVVGRQIYSYATAKRMGWSGSADAAVEHGLSYLKAYALQSNGLVVSSSWPDGTIVRADFDLYDHAFALFGLAAAAGVMSNSEELAGYAKKMLMEMRAGWGHSVAGFEETMPRSLPLKANPHMHIFEAALAWIESMGTAAGQEWHNLADEIGELCLAKFLHPDNGCLREFFDGDWRPFPGEDGRIVEPGHQFEWGWLLIRWGLLRNRQDAINAAKRLILLAEDYGVDPVRGVAFNEIWDDFTPKDQACRLWQQTERLKAWIAMSWVASDTNESELALASISKAAAGLKKFLWTADVSGAWNERMKSDGSFVDEPSPASSLYHIICAIAEMHKSAPQVINKS